MRGLARIAMVGIARVGCLGGCGHGAGSHHRWEASRMRAAKRCAAAAVVLASTIVVATTCASSPVNGRRCGYGHRRYWGRVALYPWHLSCGAARRTLTQSESRHHPIITFTADGADTFDAGALKRASGGCAEDGWAITSAATRTGPRRRPASAAAQRTGTKPPIRARLVVQLLRKCEPTPRRSSRRAPTMSPTVS